MTYLVDANVLCEPAKRDPNAAVVSWLARHERMIVVDPVILGEVHIGILSLPMAKKRQQLQRWFDGLIPKVECIPWDAAVSACWAQLVVDLKKKGRPVPLLDSMIAATALAHNLTVATHNTKDFKPTGVKLFNPFS